jgi:predicted transcriptional regulator
MNITKQVLELIAGKKMTVGQVATKLDVSDTTVYRCLAAENTSYSELVGKPKSKKCKPRKPKKVVEKTAMQLLSIRMIGSKWDERLNLEMANAEA